MSVPILLHTFKKSGPSATLTLNSLVAISIDFDFPFFTNSAVRVTTAGQVWERKNGNWVLQNSGVEWIDDAGATASDYEAKVVKTSGNMTADLTGWTALDTYHDIDTTLGVDIENNGIGDYNWNGTLTIREKANTSNFVSASVALVNTNGI